MIKNVNSMNNFFMFIKVRLNEYTKIFGTKKTFVNNI